MKRVLLAGFASLGLAAFSAPALAKSPEIHVLTVQLPGGGVAWIRYTGQAPPAIVFAPGAGPVGYFAPMPAMPTLFGPGSPFAMMQRIEAEMNRETANLIRQVESMRAFPAPGPLTAAAFGRMAPGETGYSFVSTMSGNGVCTESMQITYSGHGAPKVVSARSGDCGPAAGAAPAAVRAAPRPAPAEAEPPGTILASNTTPSPGSSSGPSYASLVHEANWRH